MVKRILVFDDKPENLRVAQQAYEKLAKYGYSVETTSSPDEALDKIERGEADILVTDLYAPREIVSPRILDRWKKLTTETAKELKRLKKEGKGDYTLSDEYDDPVKIGKKMSNRNVNYRFKHPGWEADIQVPYDEIASLNRVMSMEPTRLDIKRAKSYEMPYTDQASFDEFWRKDAFVDSPIKKPAGEDFTLEEFKKLNPHLDDSALTYIFEGHQRVLSAKRNTSEGVRKAKMNVPVGVVLYDAAREKGIPVNMVSDTHRHALVGTPDIRGVVLPLLVKDPSLVTTIEGDKNRGYLDPSRIRTNANKQEVSSWYYGGGYERASASFLPEELKGLAGETLEERLEQKSSNEGIDLGKKVTSIIATLSLLSGIFFLSPNMTGNTIANVSQNSSNLLGAVLLLVGLVAGFFWVKKK